VRLGSRTDFFSLLLCKSCELHCSGCKHIYSEQLRQKFDEALHIYDVFSVTGNGLAIFKVIYMCNSSKRCTCIWNNVLMCVDV